MTLLLRTLRTPRNLGILAAIAAVISCSNEPSETSAGSGGDASVEGCAAGLLQCGAACVNPLEDRLNCGDCGLTCLAWQSCNSGVCTCPQGTTECGATCANTQTDVANCGTCGNACFSVQACNAGVCTCPQGTTECGATCVNTQSDGMNCGSCGSVCASGQVCAAGLCTTECPAGLTQCGSSCVDAMTELAHCGACDRACLPGQVCSTGTCACPPGQQVCDGQCVDPTTSATHCGSCGNQCTSGATCNAGACEGGDPPDGATFQIDLTLSSAIATVGIVEWSIDVPIDRAVVNFGRTQDTWEHQATVDLNATSLRTLLLGMKPATTYYVQIEAGSGTKTYTSEVLTIETEFLPNGMPPLTISTPNEAALYGGFTINCTGTSGASGMAEADKAYAFIFDRDGDYVWAYDLVDTPVTSCSRARMSFDGKYMFIGNFSNVSDDGAILRVSMDGLDTRTYDLPGRHHDFTVLPNGNVLYQEQANGGGYDGEGMFGGEGPDLIQELDTEAGTSTLIYDEMTDFSIPIDEANGAHTNFVTYVPHLDAISISLRHSSTIGLLDYPSGNLIAVFGGTLNQFPDMEWSGQHGHQFLEDRLLVFNNNGTNGGASVLEYTYDLDTKAASLVFDYSSGVASPFFGEAQRLPNGNTFVTYSPSGTMHEADANAGLVREITTSTNLGYSRHRKTLYGPPPPVGD